MNPRVLLVMPSQWPRALLRAELREIGYDAIGVEELETVGHEPVALVIVDYESVATLEPSRLEAFRRSVPGAALVLLGSAVHRIPEGPWDHIIRRPVEIGDLVRTVELLVPLVQGSVAR